MRIIILAPPDATKPELQACFQAAVFAKDHAGLGPKPGDVMLVTQGDDYTQTRAVVRRKTGVTVYAKGYWDREE